MSVIICDANLKPLEHLTQWDTNRTIMITGLDLESAPTIKFYSPQSKQSIAVTATLVGSNVAAVVPNTLLQDSATITASVVISETSGTKSVERTVCQLRIPVIPSSKPEDYGSGDEDSEGMSTTQIETYIETYVQQIFREDNFILNSGTSTINI